MSTTADILHYAYNKDAENLKAAVNSYMEPLIADKIADMMNDVASSLFSATTGEVEVAETQDSQEATQTTEEPNEDVQTDNI